MSRNANTAAKLFHRGVLYVMLGLLFYMNRAEAASTGNGYVMVSCAAVGVENIVVVGDGFHLTTVNVGESFSASVQVVAQPGWELLSAASLTLSPGGISVYTVRNIANPEIEESGDIILFKVDVEISGIGEDKEETEGALAGYADCGEGYSNTNCLAAMKSVTIRCLPANRPDDEEITLSFPSGHLLEKVGATYQIANSSYKACEIGSKSFWLHGHTSSTSLCDYEIKAEHSVNGCTDVAKYTVVKVDILDPAEGDVHLKGEEITYDGMVEPSGLGGMVFSWSLLEGTCNPSSAATEDFQTTLMSEGNIKVKFAVTIGGAVFEATRFISAMLPEVVELSWIDDLAMEKWKGDAIVDPVWKKPLGGDVIKSDSGAYIKNHNAKAKLVIEAAEQLTHSTRAQVRGLGTENFSAKCIWFHRWTWNSDELVLESSPLYNSVNFYDPFHITWSYRVAKPSGGWGDWIQMNRSSHILYTVNAQPAASRLYEQGVDKACRYASGAADFAAAINSGLANEIYYDPTRESPHDLDIYDEGRGQCCCHAHVLVLLISHVTDISPSPEFVWGGCSNSAICFYRHGTGWWGPSFQCQRPAVDNAEANPHFTFHVVVPFAGTIYDPSYGVTGHAPFLETAPAHPEAASFQSGSALPVAAHYVDWTCGPH